MFIRYLLSIVLVFLVSAPQSFAAEQSPRLLVHLLDYLAKDYPGAVANGKVLSESEYAEQVEFINSAVSTGKTLSILNADADLIAGLELLDKHIKALEAPEKVSALARQLQTRVIQISNLELAPTQWPELANGEKLFAANCAVCHGAKGMGDGPAGQGLDPKPANFHNREAMDGTSPFQEFNAIRIGIPGTGMTPFPQLSDKEVWDLAFFAVSLRYERAEHMTRADLDQVLSEAKLSLADVASQSDNALSEKIAGSREKSYVLRLLRTYQPKDDQGGSSLVIARTKLKDALDFYGKNDFDSAKTAALAAYLEGVEPIEARLKATDLSLVPEIEVKMAQFRNGIDSRRAQSELEDSYRQALLTLDRVQATLDQGKLSPWVSFSAASAILLREGFEAVLVIIALLSVIRASGVTTAAIWVHAGWFAALLLGLVAWFFSGWLIAISGAQRELLEGGISLFAVLVLLVVGFWLHSQTEITRWKQFIGVKVKKALEGKNLFGLAIISFMAVFREAFETVLFLRAVWLDGGEGAKVAMSAGVFGSLIFIFVFAWLILKYSVKLPIRQLFGVSAFVMAVLALILTGKGLHSLQEMGALPATISTIDFRSDLLGFYPTLETILSQILVLALVVGLWVYGRKPQQNSAAAS